MTHNYPRALLGLGSWKRAALVAAAVLLALGARHGRGAERAGRRPRSRCAQAVRTAIDRTGTCRPRGSALEEANEQVSEAWSNVYPSVDFNASYTRNVSPTVNFLPAAIFNPDAGPDDYIRVQFGADNQWNSTISLEQPLFSAAAFIGVGAAGRYKSLQEEVVRGVTQDVVTQVRLAYYQLLLAQEQLRLTENSRAPRAGVAEGDRRR